MDARRLVASLLGGVGASLLFQSFIVPPPPQRGDEAHDANKTDEAGGHETTDETDETDEHQQRQTEEPQDEPGREAVVVSQEQEETIRGPPRPSASPPSSRTPAAEVTLPSHVRESLDRFSDMKMPSLSSDLTERCEAVYGSRVASGADLFRLSKDVDLAKKIAKQMLSLGRRSREDLVLEACVDCTDHLYPALESALESWLHNHMVEVG